MSNENINWLLKIFRGPPSEVRRPKSVPPSLRRDRPATTVRKHRKDYHWSVWKTTPTPPPPSELRESPRTKSRLENEDRPKTRASQRKEEINRPSSRATEIADANDRNEVFGTPMPEYCNSNIRPTSRTMFKTQNISALKNLINNSNEYERQVAANLLKAMENSGRRAQSAKPSKSYSYGVRTTYTEPNFPQMYGDESARCFRMLSENLQGYDYGYAKPGGERPMHVHQRRGPPRKDFIHERSFFTNARSPYKSSFVIHPEFVSESKEYWNIRKNNQRF